METISTLIGVGIVVYFGYRLFNGFYVAPQNESQTSQEKYSNKLSSQDKLEIKSEYDKYKIKNSFQNNYSDLIEKLNIIFFNNTAILKIKNETEYILIPPANSIFINYFKFTYFGNNLSVFVYKKGLNNHIDENDEVEMVYAFKPLNTYNLSSSPQSQMATEFILACSSQRARTKKLQNLDKSTKPRQRNTKPAIANPAIQAWKNELDTRLGREATFQDFVERVIKTKGYDYAEEIYNGLRDAVGAIGVDVSQAQEIYNTYFNADEI